MQTVDTGPATATIQIPIGDDPTIPFTLSNGDGTPFDLTGGGIVNFGMTLPAGTLSKSSSTAGIAITNAPLGQGNLTLDSVDTASLKPGRYPFAIRGINAAGKKSTQVVGVIVLLDHAAV